MSDVKVRTLPKGKQVEPIKNSTKVSSETVIPIGNDVAMVYLTLTRSLDEEFPDIIIGRKEYQRIMAERRKKTQEYIGTKKEDGPKWIPLPGDNVLKWTQWVDLSNLVPTLLARGFKLVGTEQGLAKDGRSRKVWITFVKDKYYRPPVAEFAVLKKKILDWLQEDMFAPDKRMNILIYVNPLKRSGEEKVDPAATSVVITTDREFVTENNVGGLNLRLGDEGLVLSKGPAQH